MKAKRHSIVTGGLKNLKKWRGESELAGIYDGNGTTTVKKGVRWQDWDKDPESVTESQKVAREMLGNSLFLEEGLLLKIGFANAGFQIKALNRGEGAKLKEWLRSIGPAGQKQIRDFVKELWKDFYLMDCAVAFWRDAGNGKGSKNVNSLKRSGLRPVWTLQPENCKYTDLFGMETLKVRMELTNEQIKTLPSSMTKYKEKEVELKEADGEYFRVLKKERRGNGFGMPRISSLFRTLRTEESLQVADSLWSFLSRSAIRHFPVGHEIKSGPLAGRPIHVWTPKVNDAIKKLFEGKFGIFDFCSNFDIDIKFPFPSLDRFDKKKYEGVYQRMAYWLGPIGRVFLEGKLDESLMKVLRAEMQSDREDMRLFLLDIFNQVFNPGVEIDIRWNEKIFMDSRQYLELLKFLMAQGAMSQRTGLEAANELAEEQRDFKAEEFALSQEDSTKGQVLPLFDPAHGNRPGQPEGAKGRPAGQKN